MTSPPWGRSCAVPHSWSPPPVAAAAAIPVCAAIGTVGIGLGASSSAVVSAGITAVGAVETAATTIGTTLGGVGLAEAVKDVRQ